MPELPEVENIKLQLNKFIVGHKIVDVEVRNKKQISGDTKNVVGKKIKNTRRYAKILELVLDNDYSIFIHVKLTGQLIYRGPNLKNPPELSSKVLGGLGGPYSHIIFKLDKGGTLYFNDVRRFGWIKIIKTDLGRNDDKIVGKLGPEPHVAKGFAGQALTFEYFSDLLSKSKRNIKTLLMDQSKISGIGNIYANDALWLARFDPRRSANSLDDGGKRALLKAIEKVLRVGLKMGGASDNTFVTPDGQTGKYQKFVRVYGRTGQLCKRPECKKKQSKIQRITISGRGTFYCSNCQK